MTDLTARLPARERMPDVTGVTALYKYRRCEVGDNFSKVTDMLSGRLWFSPLGEFNDPFEGRPCFVAVHPDPKKQQQEMLGYLKSIALKRGLRGRDRLQLMERARNTGFGREMLEPKGLHEMLTNDCFVFSMTAKHDHPLMWSHYSDEHKGICVHFNPKVQPLSVAMLVDYDERYPEIPVPVSPDYENLLNAGTLRKAKYWEYESEYRLVSIRSGNPTWDLGTKWDESKRIARIDPAAIVGVTLGVRMPEPVRKELRAWRDSNRSDVPLFDATMSRSEYKLEFSKAY